MTDPAGLEGERGMMKTNPSGPGSGEHE
jgi:hypothetical protein